MLAHRSFQLEAWRLKLSQQSGRGSNNTVHLPISYQLPWWMCSSPQLALSLGDS